MEFFNKIKRFFCVHPNGNVCRWHYIHIPGAKEVTQIEIQMYCPDCDKVYYQYIMDNRNNYMRWFAYKYKKYWVY